MCFAIGRPITPSPMKPTVSFITCLLRGAYNFRTCRDPASRLSQGYGGLPKPLAKEEAGHYFRHLRGLIMKRIIVSSAILALSATPLLAGGSSVSGSYVEARTAEVFTGGCIMGSEAETMGKEAVLAWKVDRGRFNGIALDGLAVVAAVAGDKNLGIQEVGGEKAVTRSTLFVDERANPAQRLALVAMANDLSNGTLGTIVNVSPSPITFSDGRSEARR